MSANILVFPIWKVSGRFPVPTNDDDTPRAHRMINALYLPVAVGQTAPVPLPASYPQPQEREPAGELVDARDRFAWKQQFDYNHEAQGQVAQVEARRRHAVEPLGNLWIG